MNETKVAAKAAITDPICGMKVDAESAIRADRDGKIFYFCSDHCREKFLSTPAGVKPEGKGGCCS